MGRADVWWSQWAVGLLGLLALVELIARFKLDPGSLATTPLAGSITRASATTEVARTASGDVSTRFFLALCLLGLATTLPLALSRPAAAAAALGGASVLSLAAFQTLPLGGVAAAVIAGYRLGDSGSRVLAVVFGTPFLVLALAGLASSRASGPQALAILLAALVPTAVVAGSVRLAHQETQENTATRQASEGRLLEHTARGERARISRELHDVVAHHVSMIAVQAETARLAVPGMPAEGTRHLLGIGETARAALTEMRRLLGVLREDTEVGTAERLPQPGLRQLNNLLDEARQVASGGVRLIVRGPPDRLSPGVELAVYRIVQESLTNSRRHAPGAAVDVELHYARDGLQLRIRDNGPGPTSTAPPGGHGLLGMRERISAVGGDIRIGAATGGGFLIEASLPTITERTG